MILNRCQEKFKPPLVIAWGGLVLLLLLGVSCSRPSPQAEIQAYIQQLQAADAKTRLIAATNLGRFGLVAKDIPVPALMQALNDPEGIVRQAAAISLGKLGPEASGAIPALARRLTDPDEEVQHQAAIALGLIGPESVPVLTQALQNQNPRVRKNAILALAQLGPAAKAAVPDLLKRLQDDNLVVQEVAIEALGKIGPAAQPALPELVKALSHDNWRIRASAAAALGTVGPKAKTAIPDLLQRLQDEDAVVRQRTTMALGRMGLDAVPALIAVLQDYQKPPQVRAYAAYALGDIGLAVNWQLNQNLYAHEFSPSVLDRPEEAVSQAKGTILPVLVERLTDEEPAVRTASALALEQFGLLAVPALVQATNGVGEDAETATKNFEARQPALEVLAKIATKLGDQAKLLSSSELNMAVKELRSIREAIGLQKFPEQQESLQSIRRSVAALAEHQRLRTLQWLLRLIMGGGGTLLLAFLFLLWKRPDLLLSINQAIVSSRQQQERILQQLPILRKFLEQTGATVKPEGKRGLRVITTVGRLAQYTPFPVMLSLDKPSVEDITELLRCAQRIKPGQGQQAGMLLYQSTPGVMFRVKMAEVRLSKRFVLIPMPLAALEQATVDPATATGLLAQYVERYLPGADLFDDRNAIGDTLSFFGRSELLGRLEEELLRSQGVGLFGLRKSGKTSILLQLGFALRHHPLFHIDLQPYGGKSHFGAELFNEILRQLTLLVNDRTSKPSVTLEPLPSDQPATALTADFLQRIDHLSQALHAVGYQLPILGFLDEVERILPLRNDPTEKVTEFNAFFGVLRALSQDRRQLGFLIADVHPDCNRINQWPQEEVPTNPVFSFFKEVMLAPFTEVETLSMVTDIGRLMGRDFDPDTLSRIHHLSGGHPFIARQLASLLCAKIPEKETPHITPSAAQRYLDKPFTYSSILKDYFAQNIWADLQKRQFTAAMQVLSILACNTQIEPGLTQESLRARLPEPVTESQLLDALLWLAMVGLIRHIETTDQDYYQDQVPLLSQWLRMEMGEEQIRQWQIP